VVRPARRTHVYRTARGVQPDFHGRAPVIGHEYDSPIVRPGRDPREALESLPSPRAQLVGNLAVACRDGDPHRSASLSDDPLEMRFRRPGRPLPGELLREGAGAATQPRHEGGVGGERKHPVRERARITVRHQKTRLGVPDRLPEAGTVRRERGGTARRRLHVRNAPPLLRARQHDRPRTTQQPTLIRLGHEPEEPGGLAQTQRPREALEACTVVAPSGDFEDQVGTRLAREARGSAASGAYQVASTPG